MMSGHCWNIVLYLVSDSTVAQVGLNVQYSIGKYVQRNQGKASLIHSVYSSLLSENIIIDHIITHYSVIYKELVLCIHLSSTIFTDYLICILLWCHFIQNEGHLPAEETHLIIVDIFLLTPFLVQSWVHDKIARFSCYIHQSLIFRVCFITIDNCIASNHKVINASMDTENFDKTEIDSRCALLLSLGLYHLPTHSTDYLEFFLSNPYSCPGKC